MIGRRVPWPGDLYPLSVQPLLKPGDYAGPWRGKWLVCTPSGDVGALVEHSVTEHEDGTITVTPSIQIDGLNQQHWHGYLTRGVWGTSAAARREPGRTEP